MPGSEVDERVSRISAEQKMSMVAAEPVLQGRAEASQSLACGASCALGLIWGSNFIFMKRAAASITPE